MRRKKKTEHELFAFPAPNKALKSGLIAIGGDLSPERLMAAYRQGIFPWYNEGEEIQWYHPNPRFVLFPENLKISKSMESFLKNASWKITENTAFEQVIRQCAIVKRKSQNGTWINNEMIEAYLRLNEMGKIISVETWDEDILIGGFYGIKEGKVLFGESMFSHKSNASKYALISYLKSNKNNITLVDCQSYTAHLESLGASMISRDSFLELLEKLL